MVPVWPEVYVRGTMNPCNAGTETVNNSKKPSLICDPALQSLVLTMTERL